MARISPYTERKILLEVLILLASVPVFRGVWHLLDIYLFPGNPAASAWASVAMGLAALIIILYYFNRPEIKSRLKNL